VETGPLRIRLAGAQEAARIIGTSRQRVYALDKASASPRTRHPLPRPISRLAATPVWDADELERWKAERLCRRVDAQPAPVDDETEEPPRDIATVEDALARLRDLTGH
jgi:predicted DNA-binding transcriptional regulator AlpA